MNTLNLGTIFGPHLLRPHTDDPHVLIECNNVSTNFVRAIIQNNQDLFPLTTDEDTPKRLSIVFQPGSVLPWEMDSPNPEPKLVQHSFYHPKNSHLRERQNSAPPARKKKSELFMLCCT